MTDRYDYGASVKSDHSDELINRYLLRPVAGVIVRILYPTSVTPNQVTYASVAAGLAAAVLYAQGEGSFVAAGLLVTIKDLLDSADGQLARAKNLFSRTGRFLDSLGDILVNALVFAAIGWTLTSVSGDPLHWLWSALCFAGMTLRVSYHVFYHSSFLHLKGRYQTNRIIEEITPDDLKGDPAALRLQRVFQWFYGWQDRLMLRIDEWCRKGKMDEEFRHRWYGDRTGLLLSGFLGIGTELFLLMLFSVTHQLEAYLVVNIAGMNGILIGSIVYRRAFLAGKWERR